MKILHLILHKVWFDRIAAGTKIFEYRAITPFWKKRLEGKTFDEVHFRNGYSPDARFMRVEWKGLNQGWWEGKQVYAIGLGEVLEVREKAPKVAVLLDD